jgi:hypothetical protein
MSTMRSEKRHERDRKAGPGAGARASTLSAAERRLLFLKAQAKVLETHAPTFRKLAK